MNDQRIDPKLRCQLAVSPGSSDVAGALANALTSRDADLAASWALRALACDPFSARPLIALSTIWANAGELDLAAMMIRRAAALEPSLSTAWHNLASAMIHLDREAIALSCQRRASVLGTPDEHRYQLVFLEILLGDADAASRHLVELLARLPRHDSAIGMVYEAMKRERSVAAALLSDVVVAHFSHSAGVAMVHQRARLRLGRSQSDIRTIQARWGVAPGDTLYPVDAERRLVAPGHMLIRGFGCGFWGEVTHVAINAALAEITGRIPLVYWGHEVRYRKEADGNAWDLFFEPLSDAGMLELRVEQDHIFPGHWTAASLFGSEHLRGLKILSGNPHGISAISAVNRAEAVVVADGYVEMRDVLAWAPPGHPWRQVDPVTVYQEIFARLIRPRPHIAQSIGQIGSDLFAGLPVIAVHVRAQSGGKDGESIEKTGATAASYFAKIDDWLAERPDFMLFLLTDVHDALDAFRQRYGKRVLALDRMRMSHPSFGQSAANLPTTSDVGCASELDGYQLGLEVLVDAYLAAACDRFIGDGASAVSCSIVNLKAWKAEDIALVRRNVFLERSAVGREYT